MNPLFEAAEEFQAFAVSRGWRFCFIGGLAVIRWGESRMTRDVDLSLLTGFGGEAAWVDPLLDVFAARDPGAREFALRHRTLLLTAANGVPLDVCLAALPFEERMVGRAGPFAYAPGVELITCSAEDLIVLKAFADRERDWVDMAGVVARQGARLDRELVLSELEPLCSAKEAPEIVERTRRLLDKGPR